MRKITVFNHATVDGFFAGPNGEIDWFKVIKKDEEAGWHQSIDKLSESLKSLEKKITTKRI